MITNIFNNIDNLINPIITGLIINMIASPIGCFLLWSRMVFLSDILVHCSVLGISLAIVLNLPIILSTFIVSLLTLFMVNSLKSYLSSESILTAFSYGFLAIGLTIFSKVSYNNDSININYYLFGDILLTTNTDTVIILGLCLLIWIFLLRNWDQIILWMISPELAHVNGINIKILEKKWMIILTLSLISILKTSGILLAPALLIFPSIIASQISKTPWNMILLSIILGFFITISSFLLGINFNLPIGSTGVSFGFMLFLLIIFLKRFIMNWRE